MNRTKLCAVIYFIAAIFGFINAFIQFKDSSGSRGLLWLIFGLALTGLAAYYLLKRGR